MGASKIILSWEQSKLSAGLSEENLLDTEKDMSVFYLLKTINHFLTGMSDSHIEVNSYKIGVNTLAWLCILLIPACQFIDNQKVCGFFFVCQYD